jgi:signal transduction histidine kinase
MHDTLLQGLVGATLQFKVISDTLQSSPLRAKEQLDRLRVLLEHSISETRQSIWDLRSTVLQTDDLAAVLTRSAEALAGSEVSVDVTVSGTPYPCDSRLQQQLLRVAQEAISNAVNHGEPSHIGITLGYYQDSIQLRVVDNGRGFDLEDPTLNDRLHWGLTGMRERAQVIHGQLRIVSAPGEGTTLELVVPAFASS